MCTFQWKGHEKSKGRIYGYFTVDLKPKNINQAIFEAKYYAAYDPEGPTAKEYVKKNFGKLLEIKRFNSFEECSNFYKV